MARISNGGIDSNHVNGSIGSHTYRNTRGQLVVSMKATDVTDPRSYDQVKQRAKWLNPICLAKEVTNSAFKFAFEDKTANQLDLNLFFKYALKISPPVYINKEMREKGLFVPAPYDISRGSVHEVECHYDAEAGAVVSNIFVSDITDETTVRLFAIDVTENQGWLDGDKLIYLTLIGTPRPDGYIEYKTYGASVELNINDKTKLLDVLPHATVVDGKLAITCDKYSCAAFIHQRITASGICVSDQHLILGTEAEKYCAAYQTVAAREAAMKSIGGWKDSLIGSRGSTHLSNGVISRSEDEGDTPTPPGPEPEPTGKYRLTLSTNNASLGSTTPAGTTEYDAGTEVTIKANIIDDQAFFDGWSDGNEDQTRQITMTKDYTLEARFSK